MTKSSQGSGAFAKRERPLFLCWAFALAVTLLTACDGTKASSVPAPNVQAAYPDVARLQVHRVTATPRRNSEDITILRTATGAIATTPEHPFAVSGRGWTRAGQLRIGQSIVSAQKETATILQIEERHEPTLVYNLAVEGSHVYFVGADALLVHNQCDPAYEESVRKAKSFLRRHPYSREVHDYSAFDHTLFNGVLRGELPPSSPANAHWRARARRLEQLLTDAGAAGLGYEGAVFRGENLRQLPRALVAQYMTMPPGAVLPMASFLSTSADPSVAARHATADGVILKIHATRRGIPIASVSKFSEDREVLFPPDSSFRLVNRSRDSEGRLFLEFEEVS